MTTQGFVSLVGAGPGDPELLTIKGQRRLAAADVVIYDALVNPALLSHCKPGAEQIRASSQEEINELLVDHGQAGRVVVRLTNGDPFVFGRGGVEAELLNAAGIRWEVVPGVPTTIAAPGCAGIPATHRDWSASFAVIAVREERDVERLLDWGPLSSGVDTLLIYMARDVVQLVTKHMLDAGRSPAMTVAVVRRGSLPDQQVVEGTLGDLPQLVAESGFEPPFVLAVGPTVKLRQQFAWTERRPLHGKRIVVTRAREQASGLVEQLQELGAQAIEYPVIAFEPAPLGGELDNAIINLESYDWIIFTSVNGVRFFMDRLRALGQEVTALSRVKLGAIGPATAAELERFQLRPTFVPDEYVAEAVVDQIGDVKDKRFLLPRADIAREALPQGLLAKGAHVDEVAAYHTILGEPTTDVPALLRSGKINAVTFTSSSTVRHFLELLGRTGVSVEEARKLLENVTVAAIGPITANTVREHGLKVDISAERYTIEGLVTALTAALGGTEAAE